MENSENKSIISTGSSNLAKTEKLLSITQKILSEIKPRYESVKIGNQEWMTINLDVDRFSNGDLIPKIESDKEWEKAGRNGQPAWCYYDNDPENGKKYGKLYNWFAVADSRGLAPEGWYIPLEVELTSLLVFLGGINIAGYKIKSVEGWKEWQNDERKIQNWNGDNSSGFNALPGGFRSSEGTFKDIRNKTIFLIVTESNDRLAHYLYLRGYKSMISNTNDFKELGTSVRCLRDDY